MNAEQLHNQGRAYQRQRWAVSEPELAVKVNGWQEAELAAGEDPQILAEVVRLVALNLCPRPARGQRHSFTLAGIQSQPSPHRKDSQ